MRSRRRLLRSTAVGLSLGLAGCAASLPEDESTPTRTATDTPTAELNVASPDPVSEATFNSWEPDTSCNDGKRESMYNSEISVQNVVRERPDGIDPVVYDDLPDGEKRILAEVLAVGGYATCETSEAFQSFLERAVYEHAEGQENDAAGAYLEYDTDYYQLYLRKGDQVYAY